MKSPYSSLIEAELSKLGRSGYSSGQVEALMRVGHPTLDGLSATDFRIEVAVATQAIDIAPELARDLAKLEGWE